MKTRSKAAAVIFTLAVIFAVSCSRNDGVNSDAPKQNYNSTGVIRAIDAAALEITIDHEDIPGFMSAMEMDFTAASANVFNGFAAGDKVAFVLERTGGKVTLTSITKAGETASVNGAEVYASNCAECHGAKGEGAKKGIPLISGHALAHSEEEFVEQVANGEEKKMPAFRDKLSDDEIAAVVRFVREVIQKDVKKDGNTKHEH